MRIIAVYHLAASAREIESRAQNLAVEQSVEMPLDAIEDERVLTEIAGQVESIEPLSDGLYRVSVALAAETFGEEPGQIMNMLFGNSSLHAFITLEDVEMPEAFVRRLGGPNLGAAGLRERAGAAGRAMTCAALKPQGLSPDRLATLAGRFAEGGIDYIKDDHGLADQRYSPFAARVPACAAAVRRVAEASGHSARYAPSLSGHLDQLRAQLRIVREEGVDTVVTAPMVIGLPAFQAITSEHPDIAFLAHPAMGGAARIAPPLLLGKLFRLFGADATIFPNYGGRFGYSPETCAAIASVARGDWHGIKPTLSVPAGGMTRDRLPELIDFYGTESMILIGGGLLSARERLTSETAAFVAEVAALSSRSPTP
jgi:ribulose-bisphosphate carboxylase large chain